ncbi:two-component system, NarL family, invasion response regulator UvrY [Gammaproteobacteria bacterium]
MIKVLIADDHPIVRQGLRQILSGITDISLTGEAVNGQEALDQVRGGSWDVLVLDITMPDCNGFDVLKELKKEQPNLPVLVFSIHGEEQFAVRAIKAGASGYLSKENAPSELVKAIRKVVGGGKYISLSLAETLAFGLDAAFDRPQHELLSDREFQVMQMMASGKTFTEIADTLSLSVKTVSTYRARILEKMNLRTNAELIRYAIENHLVIDRMDRMNMNMNMNINRRSSQSMANII